MNICIVTSSYPRTPVDAQSAGVFVRDFALELAKRGPKVFVLTQARIGEIKDDPELTVIRFKSRCKDKTLSTLNLFNPQDALKMVSVIRQGGENLLNLVQSEGIDFCIAMWAVPSGYWAYIAKKKFGTPYIVWALGSDIWNYGKYPVVKSIVKKVLNNSNELFADGVELARDVERLSKKKCEFLPSTRVLPKSDLLNIQIDKTKTNFLFIGRYHKNKGIDILIDAINLIPRSLLVNMRFHIFGGGGLESVIKKKVNDYELEDFVMINGFADTKTAASYLSACDCLIIPSRIESIPCVLSDGLQMGTPVIVSDVGDMGRVVKEYNAGTVVKAESPEELKNAIVGFNKDNKKKYIEGINKLYTLFDLKKSVDKILEVEGVYV